MPAPVRPVFKNGQRLTADRLTQAFDYLRSWIRRLSLGPLSAGVAGGLTLQPFGGDRGLIVQPGVAIDGRGRLLLLSEPQFFTPEDLESRIGFVGPGSVVRVRLALLDGGTSLDPCADTAPTAIEDVQVLFDRTAAPSVVANQPPFGPPSNCVAPHDPLDLEVGTDCSVTLGHVIGQTGGTLQVLNADRDGVSAQLGMIRNPAGVASVALGQMMIEFDGQNNLVDGVAVSRPTLFTERARFLQRTIFENAGGRSLQATRVAFVGKNYSAGEPWVEDGRVFVFPGGAGNLDDSIQVSDVPAGRGGLCAIPCQVSSTSTGPIERAGIVLAVGAPVGLVPTVLRPSTQTQLGRRADLIGLSAKRQISTSGVSIVPVATAGLVKVLVEYDQEGIGLGAQLTAGDHGSDRLQLARSGSDFVLARAAQNVAPATPDPATGEPRILQTEILAWVVHPPSRGNA